MTTRPPNLRLLSLRLVLEQIGLALLVFALFALWLRIPDASAINVLGSVLLAILIVAVAVAGESSLILRLCGCGRPPRRLLRGALILLAAALLWFGWNALLTPFETRSGLYAGYLNSRLPHQARTLFSYPHILQGLSWLTTILRVFGAGVLAIFAFPLIASAHPARAIRSSLHSGVFWIALLLGGILVPALTRWLVGWTPGHGLRPELLSLVARLTVVVLLNAAVVSLLLTLLAERVRETDLLYSTPGGTPADNHPRTAEKP